jgi:hypothetical protein
VFVLITIARLTVRIPRKRDKDTER